MTSPATTVSWDDRAVGFFSAVRARPFAGDQESTLGFHRAAEEACVSVRDASGSSGAATELHNVSFDAVFPETAHDEEVYTALRPLVRKACRPGATTNVIAYGQTGSGKTHTIVGLAHSVGADLFSPGVGTTGVVDSSMTSVEVSCVELLGDELSCLLTGDAIKAREEASGPRGIARGGLELVGAGIKLVTSLEAYQAVIKTAFAQRKTASTQRHDRSSRSHAVVFLRIQQSGCSPQSGTGSA